jgi:hypothetical protein
MQRNRPKKIPKKERSRNYLVERDPDPNLRWFDCDFAPDVDENEWH